MTQTLERWCNQNSGSYHPAGLAAMCEMLCEDYATLGHGPRRTNTTPFTTVEDDGSTRHRHTADLIRWDFGEEASRRLLLMIHYDTVYPPDSEPSRVRITPEHRMIGPGTADAKGGLLIMLEALAAVRQFELDDGIGWTAVANPDEEIGAPASTPWMYEHAAHFDFGLLFEPTLPDGSLVAARKGSGNFTIVVHGRSAHAGRNPQDGRNAVVKLCELLTGVAALEAKIDGITVNVARFQGGSALNRVPDLAVGRFNVRALDHVAQHAVTAAVQQAIAEENTNGDFRIELSGGFQSPPKTDNPDQQRLRNTLSGVAEAHGRSLSWKDTGGSCDGSKLADAGLPNIDTLGPRGDRLHSPDEWVDLESLVPCAQFVTCLIAHYAQHPHDFPSRSRD